MHNRVLPVLSILSICAISLSSLVWTTGPLGARAEVYYTTITCTSQTTTTTTLTIATTTTKSEATTVTLTPATTISTTSSVAPFPDILGALSSEQILGILAAFWILATIVVLLALAAGSKRLGPLGPVAPSARVVVPERVPAPVEYAQAVAPVLCPGCGVQLPPSATFCPNCGNRLSAR